MWLPSRRHPGVEAEDLAEGVVDGDVAASGNRTEAVMSGHVAAAVATQLALPGAGVGAEHGR
ncbi:hypothetical protein [Streptomyces sp. NPDC056785]|uniref:hypothetical protein n=1 Tax=Streptomyces sp. NPDC056785 TaxID=3345944 RepID=UPI0036CFCCF3